MRKSAQNGIFWSLLGLSKYAYITGHRQNDTLRLHKSSSHVIRYIRQNCARMVYFEAHRTVKIQDIIRTVLRTIYLKLIWTVKYRILYSMVRIATYDTHHMLCYATLQSSGNFWPMANWLNFTNLCQCQPREELEILQTSISHRFVPAMLFYSTSWTMAHLAGIDKGPVLDWIDDNGLMEHFRMWKKKVEILFWGPLTGANDAVKCNYIIYWLEFN